MQLPCVNAWSTHTQPLQVGLLELIVCHANKPRTDKTRGPEAEARVESLLGCRGFAALRAIEFGPGLSICGLWFPVSCLGAGFGLGLIPSLCVCIHRPAHDPRTKQKTTDADTTVSRESVSRTVPGLTEVMQTCEWQECSGKMGWVGGLYRNECHAERIMTGADLKCCDGADGSTVSSVSHLHSSKKKKKTSQAGVFFRRR